MPQAINWQQDKTVKRQRENETYLCANKVCMRNASDSTLPFLAPNQDN